MDTAASHTGQVPLAPRGPTGAAAETSCPLPRARPRTGSTHRPGALSLPGRFALHTDSYNVQVQLFSQ